MNNTTIKLMRLLERELDPGLLVTNIDIPISLENMYWNGYCNPDGVTFRAFDALGLDCVQWMNTTVDVVINKYREITENI